MLKPEVIENAGDDGIDDIENGLRAVVEGRDGGDDLGAGFEEGDDVAGLDEVPGGFAGDEDEGAFFLEEDVGGAGDGAVGVAVGDAAEGAHGAGDDDHGVEAGGAADVGDLHGGVAVDVEAVGDGELADFGLGDFAGVGAEGDVDFVRGPGVVVEELEEALGVEGAAGAGDGHDEFHIGEDTRGGGREQMGPMGR